MEIPKNFATEVNKIVFDFIWKQKPAKVIVVSRVIAVRRVIAVKWSYCRKVELLP